ncbi:hypothetical protein SAMN05661010_02532 [Modicisalibacter muralis]|uniref:Uncharacterized protein n=1 Tax=Modicisalibacter muralis TaxID=119000 RepID=A0A1G9MV05_9GAMM|nr:hypothetical protein [Halomonas muralis]SDL78100.1 hypothetical protein SAMN05661010_02532 [Halomonas muralis]
MSNSSMIVTEAARITPVGVGWAAISQADPSTQVTLVAGLLTCLYMLLQTWLIIRKLRAEKRRLQMDEREHERRMGSAQEGDAT